MNIPIAFMTDTLLTEIRSYQAIWWETIVKSKSFCLWILWKCPPDGLLLLYPLINVSHLPGVILVNVNISPM